MSRSAYPVGDPYYAETALFNLPIHCLRTLEDF